MIERRVTKYDPRFRDARGAYTRGEWTSIRDIGRCFEGAVLTRDEYQRVEDAYVATALGFMREAGQSGLSVVGLENHALHALDFGEGDVLGLDCAGEVIRRLLREDFWCRLEAPNAFVHVGWDFYMYVGVPDRCPRAERLSREVGLFVEEHPSPYGSNA